jgi:serine/threonine protein kinase
MLTPGHLEGLPGLTVGELLGRGGFGAVYRARHHALDVEVAVKLIETSALDAEGFERTLREARLMARLDHPNLLRIFHAGQTSGAVYLVLELMDGGSCKGMRNLSPDRAVAITKQLLSGLQALHDARILHRDVKPANCLHRSHDARVKLADLGIAAEWMSMSAKYDWAGTIPFMAPELFEHPPRYSPCSDLYALGVTLACLLLSSDPFPSGSFDALRDWVLNGTRPRVTSLRPDLPPVLARLVDRMMSPRLKDRPSSAAGALVTLAGVEALPPTVGTVITSPESTRTLSPALRQLPVKPIPQVARIGAWELGEVVYSSTNWLAHVVTHVHTGSAARLVRLKPTGPLADQSEFILTAAGRASRLSHPHLVAVIDWGLSEGRVYVVTTALGRTLQDLVDNGQPLEEYVAIPFMAALADALSYLHGLNLVYQLVDPGSTLVGSNARSATLSWPLFCVPTDSENVGGGGVSQRFLVRAYGAPEVLSGASKRIEPSVDLFGLGATFCYLLAGKDEYFSSRKKGGLPDLREHSASVTAPFAKLITRLTDSDPQQRPSALQTKEELYRIGSHLGIRVGSE